MALVPISVAPFPDVPDLPGVPSLARDPLAAAVTVAAPAIQGILGSFEKKWGVFDTDGNAVLTPDTFLGISYTTASTLAQAPLERGSFTSYNKVGSPFEGVVHLAVGGSQAERENFLADLEKLAADTNLYTLITPEAAYRNCNLERFDYRRTQRNGAGLIEAHCYFKEIRQAKGSQYSIQSSVPEASKTNTTTSTGMPDPTNVKAPSAAAPVSQGLVSAKTPSAQAQGAATALGRGGW